MFELLLYFVSFTLSFIVGYICASRKWKKKYVELENQFSFISDKFSIMSVKYIDLAMSLSAISKILNKGKFTVRKNIEPSIVIKGEKYCIAANEDWEWEVRKTENIKTCEDEIDLRNINEKIKII